jgi:GNAT superfamily N-acetyltransferase
MASYTVGTHESRGILSSVQDFFDDYFAGTEQNPFAKYERIWEGKTAFDCRTFGGNVRLSLRSLQRGQGYGSRALDWLCALADKHGVMLTGDAVPFGNTKPMLNKRQLKEWYARHGFIVSRRGELARTPKRPAELL